MRRVSHLTEDYCTAEFDEFVSESTEVVLFESDSKKEEASVKSSAKSLRLESDEEEMPDIPFEETPKGSGSSSSVRYSSDVETIPD